MKTQFLKIAAAVMVLFFIGAGVALAKDWRGRGNYKAPKHAYGYYKHKGASSHFYGPRYSYQKHYKHFRHSYPVVVQKRYYHPPAYYYAPAQRGYYSGFSAYNPGFAFSFGVSGR